MATPNATSTSEFVQAALTGKRAATQAALTGKRAATQAALIDSEDFIRDIVRDVLQQLEVAVLLGHEFASANESPCLNLVASYPFHDYAAFGKPSAYQSAGTS
jgi:hypothetical protein